MGKFQKERKGMKELELRRLQIQAEKMLYDITQVCEKNNLKYFLVFGTAIGAARHQGFIPWDDDIDIGMPYEDYIKFLKIAPEMLGEDYFVQSALNDNSHIYAFSKVRKNGTAMIPEGLEKIHTHQGIWIDIFPIAYFKNDFEYNLKRKLLPFSTHLVMDDYIFAFEESYSKRLGKTKVSLHKLMYKIPFRLRKYLHDKLNEYICGGKGKKYCGIIFDLAKKYPYDILEGEIIKMQFENHYYNMMPGYHAFLKIQYGNYMELPPVDQRVNHSVGILDFNESYEKYLV